jgi:hypothetical protein
MKRVVMQGRKRRVGETEPEPGRQVDSIAGPAELRIDRWVPWVARQEPHATHPDGVCASSLSRVGFVLAPQSLLGPREVITLEDLAF